MTQIESLTPTNVNRPLAMSKGALQKRSMRIAGHRTSIALEPEFWQGLEKIARAQALSLPAMIAEIDLQRASQSPEASLASAVRVYVLQNKL
jgi:predicted DNA-binding ribbon-helix-helix protein